MANIVDTLRKQNETAEHWQLAVSHFQIRDGAWGDGLPLSGPLHLKTQALSSPLYLETMALVLWIIPGAASSTASRATCQREGPARARAVVSVAPTPRNCEVFHTFGRSDGSAQFNVNV